MIITICAAAVLIKIKGLQIKPFFRTWTVYPILLTQMVLIYAQFAVFLNDYTLIAYASWIKSACLFVFILPIVSFGLYRHALLGSGLIVAGTLLNKLVMNANYGKMPVFPSLSYLTGYVKPDTFLLAQDQVHILGNADTKWKVLSDYIDVGFSILSPGDVLIHLFTLSCSFKL
jgi:hypothetical protein